ncbi:MAG TPA: OsmC family protein [Polyangia bacterium]|jgi:putative redox protein
MATKTALVRLAGEGLRFEATVGSGHAIVLDSGDGDAGARPAELLGAALAGCTAMDVISILRKKRQPVDAYEVRVSGEQMDEHPHAFTRFDVVHVLDGAGLDTEAVRRAIELSATRYCSVGSTLASGAVAIHHAFLVREPGGDERYGEVLVIGPDVEPAALAAR